MDAPRRVAKRLFPKRLHPRLLNLYLKLLAPLYAGYRVHCPCCEHSFRRFVPYSIGRDVDLICPGCDSVHNLFGRDN